MIAVVSSWSRLEDRVYVADVAQVAQLSDRQSRRCLERLATLGIIVWKPRRGKIGNGPGHRSLLGLPPEGQTGQLVRPLSTRVEPAPNGTTSSSQSGQIQAAKPDAPDVRRPRRSPEKKPQEETTSAVRADRAHAAAEHEQDEQDEQDRRSWRAAFAALAAATNANLDDGHECGRVAIATRQILFQERERNGSEEGVPDEIRRRVEHFRCIFPTADMTPTALAKWWADTDWVPPPKRIGEPMTADDREKAFYAQVGRAHGAAA
ncbi:MAG: hypothetical protein ACYDA3_13505 [Gaiellaceae bacterium]